MIIKWVGYFNLFRHGHGQIYLKAPRSSLLRTILKFAIKIN